MLAHVPPPLQHATITSLSAPPSPAVGSIAEPLAAPDELDKKGMVSESDAADTSMPDAPLPPSPSQLQTGPTSKTAGITSPMPPPPPAVAEAEAMAPAIVEPLIQADSEASKPRDLSELTPLPLPSSSGVAQPALAEEPHLESQQASSVPAEPASTPIATTHVITKSGRASKPSTPALGTFPEASVAVTPSRSRNEKAKKSHKKGAAAAASSAAAAHAPARRPSQDARDGLAHNDDDDDDNVEAKEERYCYCGDFSYGEMVGCDGPDCKGQWFHIGCIGLKVAPKGNGELACVWQYCA